MKTQRKTFQYLLALCVFMVSLTGTENIAQAEGGYGLNSAAVGSYLGTKIFGDYGPFYVVTGKPGWRYVNGKRVAPREGLLSSKMRSMASRIHTGAEKANYLSSSNPFVRLNDLNIAMHMPKEGWTQIDPEKHGMNSRLLLSKNNSDILVSLGAEIVGLDKEETIVSMVAASQESMRSLPNGVVFPGIRKLSAPEMKGYQYQAAATFDTGQQLHFSIWITKRNGFSYSLTVFGDPSNKQAIDETMREFVGRISQVQPNRYAWTVKEPNLQR